MRKVQKIFHGKKFQMRILLMGIVCSLLAVILTATGMFAVMYKASDTLSRELISELTSQISLNIDNKISQIQSLLINITLDQNVLDILADQVAAGAPYNYENTVCLQNKIMQTQLIDRDINGLYVFDGGNHANYSALSPALSKDYRLQDEPWYSSLNEARGIKLLGRSTPTRYLKDKRQVVTMLQRYENLQNHETLATIVVDIKLDMFDSIMQSMALSSDYCILILDDSNELIYSNYGTDIQGTDADDLYKAVMSDGQAENSADSSLQRRTVNSFFWESTVSGKTGWTVICGTDLKNISGLTKMIRPMTAAVVLVVGILTAICLGMITKRQFRTLYVLRNGMNKVKSGNYAFHIPVENDDEIGELSCSFNEMTDQLNYLLNTVAELEREKQDAKLRLARAELEALQAQINPHFIYNTLETISMMAEINDDSDAQQMATSLGKLLRVSVKGKHLISLKEELEYIENYLLIQQIRFDDRFSVSIDIDESLYDYVVPKLILQPVVENCIHHGLEGKISGGCINITGRLNDSILELSVSDNGIGINSKELEQLQKAMDECAHEYEREDRSHHIGLSNVNQRIRLRFPSEKYGLTIHSEYGNGTTITIRLPADTTKPTEQEWEI